MKRRFKYFIDNSEEPQELIDNNILFRQTIDKSCRGRYSVKDPNRLTAFFMNEYHASF